jgi:hypothetical protein
LVSAHSNDDDNRYYSRKIPSSTISSEWLAENRYIDTSSLTSDDDFFFRCCEICRPDRPDWFKAYCYYHGNNNYNQGIHRQQITICIECLHRYNDKRRPQQLSNTNHVQSGLGGVIHITTKYMAEDQIMLAF